MVIAAPVDTEHDLETKTLTRKSNFFSFSSIHRLWKNVACVFDRVAGCARFPIAQQVRLGPINRMLANQLQIDTALRCHFAHHRASVIWRISSGSAALIGTARRHGLDWLMATSLTCRKTGRSVMINQFVALSTPASGSAPDKIILQRQLTDRCGKRLYICRRLADRGRRAERIGLPPCNCRIHSVLWLDKHQITAPINSASVHSTRTAGSTTSALNAAKRVPRILFRRLVSFVGITTFSELSDQPNRLFSFH